MCIRYFLFLCSCMIAASQELTHGYLNSANDSTNAGGNLDNTNTRQSDIWLLSRDGPIPAELNRGWSPENGYPGVQTVTALHRGPYGYRLRGSQTPINIQDRSEQPQKADEVLIFTPDFVGPHNGRNIVTPSGRPNLERNFLNLRNPQGVLVELPVGLASGFWESPRPQIIQQLSSSGRRVSSEDYPGVFQFDNVSAVIREQEASFLPNRETDSRLPFSTLQSDNAAPGSAAHELPYETLDALPVDSNSQSTTVSPTSRHDIWFPVQGRATSGLPIVIGGNEDRLLYEISFDEFPTRTPAQEDVGLTLTRDDVEILEKLGILSSFNIENIESSNITGSNPVEHSQREYESNPHLIDHVDQSYGFIQDGGYNTNLSEVVFIELPEFTTSEYHGNIPSNAERTDRVRPIPYTLSDFSATSGDSHNNGSSMNSPVFNGTSLTAIQIQEILQLLGLNSPVNSNQSSSQQTMTSKLDEHKVITSAPESVTLGLETTVLATNIPIAANVDFKSQITSIDTSTPTSSLEKLQEGLAVSQERDKTTPSPGLVSSGRIQPRILEKVTGEGSNRENEVLELISRRMAPISAQKLEMLRKLMTKPKPYVFGYNQNDGNGTVQHRNETADGSGVIKGTYGYRDPLGVYRNVNYIADSSGFHAVVKTNEPGTISHNPADAVFMSELPPQAAIAQMMAYVKRSENTTNT